MAEVDGKLLGERASGFPKSEVQGWADKPVVLPWLWPWLLVQLDYSFT